MARIINKLRNKKGFTLIELIVVLAVLAIIMAIAVPRFGGVREDAKFDSDMATLASIAKLAEFEFVRLDKGDKATGLGDGVVSGLIDNNFADGEIFQSKDLKGCGAGDVEVEFSKGKVTTITVDGNSFTYSDGKFGIP